MKNLFPRRLFEPHTIPTVPELRALLLMLLAIWLGVAAAEHRGSPQPRTLVGQLQLMAAEQGFELSGLEQIDPDAPPGNPDPDDQTTTQHIRSLLRGYDHVIVHASKKRIGRLLVLGKKGSAPLPPPEPDTEQQAPAGEIVVPTRRQGEHHLVTAKLQGAAGKAVSMELMVDTGASLVVLPSSAIETLGLKPESLDSRELQTAKGKMEADVGSIGAIELDGARVENIEVAFVEDEKLGENALLGMNVLGRYLFILDDDNNRLTLIQEGK